MYLSKGKYCVYPRMVYRLAIVMPPPPPPFWMTKNEFRSDFSPFQSNTWFVFTKWPFWMTNLISRHFRSILNFLFFSQNGCRRPFWMTENHFRSHFWPFHINTQLLFFWFFFHKMAAGGHFGWPKITFDRISRHFRSIHNFFFHKMTAGGHFGWPQITFDHISRHFRSIRNFYLNFSFSRNGCRRPIWMTENHFWMHFSPFQINTQLFFYNFFSKWPPAAILEVPFGPFWMTENHFRSHFSLFQINTQLFLEFVFKMAASGHFGSPICAKNNRVLPLCVINGYAKYEVDRWICDTVRDATRFLSIFIQNGRQRPFCFSDWWQKS